MGKDKALLQFEGKSLLQRTVDIVSAVTADVRIVGSVKHFAAFGDVVEDIYPGQGPLGGIHAALHSSKTALNLILAVDMPFVESRFLSFMLATARQCSALVTVPLAGNRLQPLCAVYRPEFGAIAESALRSGKNKIDSLFAGIQTRIIEEQEIIENGFSPAMFKNLNTPEEFEQAKTAIFASKNTDKNV
ncbi:MAG: molybdenum cofactor guanylyltransferase [Terriglobales bacterium]